MCLMVSFLKNVFDDVIPQLKILQPITSSFRLKSKVCTRSQGSLWSASHPLPLKTPLLHSLFSSLLLNHTDFLPMPWTHQVFPCVSSQHNCSTCSLPRLQGLIASVRPSLSSLNKTAASPHQYFQPFPPSASYSPRLTVPLSVSPSLSTLTHSLVYVFMGLSR